jgi:hypothetical protein
MQISKLRSTPHSDKSEESGPSTEFKQDLVDRIFIRLLRVFGPGKFKETYGDGDRLLTTKREWVTSDVVLINPKVIGEVIEFCKNDLVWPPCIAEFLRVARDMPGVGGLPEIEEAYSLACNPNSELGDALRAVVQKTGPFELKSKTREQMFPVFKRNYEIIQRRIMQGEDISLPIPKALEQKQSEFSQEQVKSGRAEFLKWKEDLKA